MREYIKIHVKCPKCGEVLEKSRYASRGRCITHWRIRCLNKNCKIDTGTQATMSDAYEALMVMYYGAEANREYERKIPDRENDGDINE